jgi:hypothetical protein
MASSSATPTSYERWNRAIADYFFGPRHEGEPVYLQIDGDTLREIASKVGVCRSGPLSARDAMA